MRLPPTVAMFRSCGEAPASSASERTGKFSRTSALVATSLLLASAPMRKPLGVGSIFFSARRLMSTNSFGAWTFIFIRSMRFVPPARNFALLLPATSRIASPRSVARLYVNGFISLAPPSLCWQQSESSASVSRAYSGSRSSLCPARLFDGGDDAVVCAAAADVAAHALAHRHARRAAFLQKPDRGHDLPRRAVAALEAVVLDEGGLHRMEFVAFG